MSIDDWLKLPQWKRDDDLAAAILPAEELKQWRAKRPFTTKLLRFIWNLFND